MAIRRDFMKQTIGSPTANSAQFTEASRTSDISSTKDNQTPYVLGQHIKALIRRDDIVVRYGGNGDNWHMSWAADDRQYVSLCDGAGFTDQLTRFYNSRMLAIRGGPHDAEFQDLPSYPVLAAPMQLPRDVRYYNFGTLALDGQLYQFMSTFNRAFRPDELEKPDLDDLVHFNGAKLIYSPDNGRTWRNQDGSAPVTWESWNQRSRDTMVFFNEPQGAFSLLTILQMGQNYEHNRDGYVYVYGTNGNTDGTMNELVLFRVPRGNLRDRRYFEYFAGDSNGVKWVTDIEARRVVHTFPRGWVNKLAHPYAWHPSVVYNSGLGLYMMANWGMGNTPSGIWFGKPSYLGFWIAKNPWGPWAQIHEETEWLPAGDKLARAYEPQIAPKWIAADGKSFWLVWTDFQGNGDERLKLFWKEYGRKADSNTITERDVAQSAMLMRQCMPYYSFNVQRVDLVVA